MTHYPAGHVSPEAFENAQRHQVRLQILHEREEQAKAELEAEIDRRLEAARGPVQVATADATSSPRPGAQEPVTK